VNYYLYDLDGVLLAALTRNDFDAANILKVDEAAGVMFYAARDGDNFMKIQVHRVGLDGRGDVRLTDPAFSHNVGACRATPPDAAATGADCAISPDNRFLVDVFQRHDRPPSSQVLDAERGKILARVADGNTTRMDELGFRPAELVTYKAADGVTTLYGEISLPSNFNPAKKYPMLVPVYGGPNSFGDLPSESFVPPNPTAEYGFLIAKVTYRGVPGTGRRGADALYMKLGRTEIDDLAEGVKALWARPYVDKTRVGIFGTSYGGYASLMAILRHPDVFAAASSSSPVTDWRNYDTVYTERYMWTPQENASGYDAASAMTYAADLKGRLLLYYDTADNNVHPSNSLQLIRALQAAGKSFDLQVGPDQPHGALNADRMMEFFIAELVVH
jgi:dipeptidyl-peptidase-4